MRTGVICLMATYLLSQFYRVFLAVLTPVLEAELGLSKADLATASGMWFLLFALMQIPVGVAFDRIGPRWTSSACLLICACGAALFARGQTAFDLQLAMALIGAGCAPILMATYFIFARAFPPSSFALLAGITVAVGGLGDVAASRPLSYAVEAFGWRDSVAAMAWVTAFGGVMAGLLVRDPPRAAVENGQRGSVFSLLRVPAIWPVIAIVVICYTPFGSLRGLWMGPYFHDVFAADLATLGRIGLWMSFATIFSSYVYGWLARRLGRHKALLLGGNCVVLAILVTLTLLPQEGIVFSALLFCLLPLFGSTFAVAMSHARLFIPPHLMGRGITVMNLFSILPISFSQKITGRIHDSVAATPGVSAAAPFAAIFGFFAVLVALGVLAYAFAHERP